jgi:hypothetical protein
MNMVSFEVDDDFASKCEQALMWLAWRGGRSIPDFIYETIKACKESSE